MIVVVMIKGNFQPTGESNPFPLKPTRNEWAYHCYYTPLVGTTNSNIIATDNKVILRHQQSPLLSSLTTTTCTDFYKYHYTTL